MNSQSYWWKKCWTEATAPLCRAHRR